MGRAERGGVEGESKRERQRQSGREKNKCLRGKTDERDKRDREAKRDKEREEDGEEDREEDREKDREEDREKDREEDIQRQTKQRDREIEENEPR